MSSVIFQILRSILLLGVAILFVSTGCWMLTHPDGTQNTFAPRMGVYAGVAFASFLPAAMIARVEWHSWQTLLQGRNPTTPSNRPSKK